MKLQHMRTTLRTDDWPLQSASRRYGR